MVGENSKPRKQMPREQRRAGVLEAARKIFLEQGFGGASMRAIAQEAGVNEAMLYRHFASKNDLFEEAVAGPLEEAVGRTVTASMNISSINPGEIEMRDLAFQFIEGMLEAMRDIAPLLNAVLLTDREFGESFYKTRFEPSIHRIISLIDENLEFWPHRNFDPDFLTRTMYGVCWFLAIDERYSKKAGVDKKDQAKQLTQLILDGIFLRESERK